ncbi:MAG: GTPase HflX [Treponema sp.]|nr:MAG: GTPase HflX [Treponema sp.]
MHTVEVEQKNALLVFVNSFEKDRTEIRMSEIVKDELKSLVSTIGLKVCGSLSFNVARTHPNFLLGKGQTESVKNAVAECGADIVVFNCEVSPRIQRNLEDAFDCCVIDRQEVIIQIFVDRAKTREAKLQAELASLEYSLPRLTRRWTELSQQRGGAFRSRGAGETKLELERRTAKARISNLKKRLKKIETQRMVQRKNRLNNKIKTGAIVGYTNSGKSSLLKALSKSDVYAEDMLFATGDAETRRVFLPESNNYALLTDTVGFVDNLPHDLIDSFRSTLEEAKYSDFLIIVCDASHPAMIDCFAVTNNVLDELGCKNKKRIVFINKTDNVYNEADVLKLKAMTSNAIEASVKKSVGLDVLLKRISEI